MEADIRVDLSATQKAANILGRGFSVHALTETMEAVETGAQAIQSEWMKYISGAPVSYSGGDFTINRVSGHYASAVMGGLRYPYNGNPLSGGVVIEDVSYAKHLERGFGPYDMKPGMLGSPKVKFTKTDDPGDTSQPYIDVPFEHAEAGVPRPIKTEVKKQGRSLGVVRLGAGLGEGQVGLRSKISPEKLGLEPYTWRKGIYAGLVRRQSGPESRGKYMTFRRISQSSDPSSWVHPGIKPRPVTRAIVENIGPKLRLMVSLAFEKDVQNLTRVAGLIQ